MKQARLFLGLLLVLFTGGLLLLATGGNINLVATPGRAPAGLAPTSLQALGDEVFVSEPVFPTVGPAIIDLPLWVADPTLDREVNPRLSFYSPLDPNFSVKGGPDPLVPLQLAAPAPSDAGFLTPLINVAGQSFTGANPPDTVGDVGTDYYVQMVNGGGTVVTIFNKSDGTIAAGPVSLSSLASGGCATGSGDPIVLYDQLAGRWLLSEFGSGNALCVYVSATGNPVTTTWFSYEFATPSFPDYPKYGVWPDAYYVTTNEGGPSPVYAMDRAAMLAGSPATFQRVTGPDLAGFGFQAMTPSDADGALPPPANSPNYVMRHRDDEVHNSGSNNPTEDYLEIWEFHVDWATPANTTFAKVADLPVTEFDSHICGLTSFSAVAMPGVAKCASNSLDPLREVLMFRLQYRNFGSHETLVGNLATDVTGADDVGIRWFELRKTGVSPWSLFQEGTYAPDGDSRWMGSVAMDGTGNIALGYSVSSGSTFPSIRYAGRLISDPAGTLPQGEVSIATGVAVNSSNRWGDYSAMNVDPVDECTFWFTNMYSPSTQWGTRVAAFRFDACGSADFTLSATPSSQSICTTDDADYIIAIGEVSGFSDPVTLSVNGVPAPASGSFSVNPATPPTTSTLTISNTGAVAVGSYALDVVGVAPTSTHTTTVQLEVYDAVPSAPLLATPVDGATNVSYQPTLTWSAAPQSAGFTVEIATDVAFSNIVESATVASSTYTVSAALNSNSTYFWRVKAANPCGGGSFTAPFSFTTEPLPGDCSIGASAAVLYPQDFEGAVSDWSSDGTGNTWALTTANANSAVTSFFGQDVAGISEQYLYGPAFSVPQAAYGPLTLQFWNDRNMEQSSGGCYDGGLLEISTDLGASWSQVPNSALLTDPYTGAINSAFENPFAGQQAWCSDTGGWIKSIVDLDAYAGQQVSFRWAIGTDVSVADDGWYIDDFAVQACVPDATYAAHIDPPAQAASAAPNATVTHTYRLFNLGLSDTYDLALSGHSWTTSLVNSGPISLAGGAYADIVVEVVIPDSAGPNSDTFTLTVTSQNDAAVVVVATGTTSSTIGYTYLPLAITKP